MKLFNKLRQKIPFSDMIYFTYVCPIQRSVSKEYQFLEAEIFSAFEWHRILWYIALFLGG